MLRLNSRRVGSRLSGMVLPLLVGGCLSGFTPPAEAARWVLIYCRQIGNHENAGSHTIESHLFRENGSKGALIGVTNQFNSGFAIFGRTDVNGWNRINPLDVNNCYYDIRIFDPGIASDNTPNFYWQNHNVNPVRYYSMITHWLQVADDTVVTAYPQRPVFHYDQIDRLNQVVGIMGNCHATNFLEPNGAWTDEKGLTTWSDYQAQTFIVPPDINRIISAQAFLTRQGGVHFTYRATIHEGSPTGPQIGPAAISRDVVSVEFREAAVCWPLDGVPVTPGNKYAIRFSATDGQGFNVYATNQNNSPSPDVMLYNGATPVPNRDMLAIVTGVELATEPCSIARNPAVLNPTVTEGHEAASQTFTVANGGDGTMVYTITDNVSWMSVTPSSGNSTGEADTITVNYDTGSLPDGVYNGTITISAADADNTPQTIPVTLEVQVWPYAPCDFEPDGDVDQNDFGTFQRCYSGANLAQTDPTCAGAKLDGDSDVDADDVAKFLGCISGPGRPADPDCAQ